jgi:hypothetical protein
MITTERVEPNPIESYAKPIQIIAFDVDQASLKSLRKALPDSVIKLINGATAVSLTQDWDPGTVDLVVVKPRKEPAQTLELCRFLVSCGVLARDARAVTDSQEEMPKTLGLHRLRRNGGATIALSTSCPGAPQ